MSKDLFFMMREEEIATSNFLPSKKEIETSSKNFAKRLIESGEHDKIELFAQAERMSLAVSTIKDEIKSTLPREKQTAFGIEISPVNGRQMIQYADDPIYADLQKKLKDREELLKLALKTETTFYDSEGIEVPKVSVKYAADSLQVKY
jgi:hypothetical protein